MSVGASMTEQRYEAARQIAQHMDETWAALDYSRREFWCEVADAKLDLLETEKKDDDIEAIREAVRDAISELEAAI